MEICSFLEGGIIIGKSWKTSSLIENLVHPTNRVILSLCKLKSLNLK